jgi:hypothetical protein
MILYMDDVVVKRDEMGGTCGIKEKKKYLQSLVGKLEEKRSLGRLTRSGGIIFKKVKSNGKGARGLDRSGCRLGQVACCCEHGNER